MIEVGRQNVYGLPNADTFTRCSRRPGLKLFRTDENRRVVLESDGRDISVRVAACSRLGRMSEQRDLKPVYLITGSDEPKVERRE